MNTSGSFGTIRWSNTRLYVGQGYYLLKRYREDMVRDKQKANTIDQQLQEFEARLRRQMLREKLDQSDSDMVRESFETGSMPQIHGSLGALQASKAPVYDRVGGD